MTKKECAKFKTLELMKRHLPKRKSAEWDLFAEGFEWGWLEATQAAREEAQRKAEPQD